MVTSSFATEKSKHLGKKCSLIINFPEDSAGKFPTKLGDFNITTDKVLLNIQSFTKHTKFY